MEVRALSFWNGFLMPKPLKVLGHVDTWFLARRSFGVIEATCLVGDFSWLAWWLGASPEPFENNPLYEHVSS